MQLNGGIIALEVINLKFYNFNEELLRRCIKENKLVILAITSKDMVINRLFKGSINKVVDMIDEDVIVGTICDNNYQMVEGILPIFPSVCIYRNHILDSVLYGFKNSDKLFESIAKENFDEQTAGQITTLAEEIYELIQSYFFYFL